MPRRYYDYTQLLAQHPEFTTYHCCRRSGSYLLAVGLMIMLVYLLHSLFPAAAPRPTPGAAPRSNGSAARRRRTTISPTPPAVGDPYDYSKMEYDPKVGGYTAKTCESDPEKGQDSQHDLSSAGVDMRSSVATALRTRDSHVDRYARKGEQYRAWMPIRRR